jgi:predicted nucleic acid-binding protein
MVIPPIGSTYYERALMLDAGPLISFYSPRDARGIIVKQFLQSFAAKNYTICITYPTIAEVHRRLLFDVGRLPAMQFISDSLDGSLNIISINERDHFQSNEILNRYNDQTISFTDATSMAIMKRLGIIKVLSYDFHFSLMGFEVISPR